MNDNINDLLQSAHNHLLAGHYPAAIQDYQDALRFDSENANTHFCLHLAYRNTNELPLALKELEEAERLSPGDGEIYVQKAYLYDLLGSHKNIPILQEIVSQLPSNAANRQVFLGLLASDQEDYPQALIHFENALQEQPNVAYLHGYLGRVLMFLGRNAEAQQALRTATRDETAKSRDLYNLAGAEKNLGNYAATIQPLERAVQIDETYYKAWLLLASMEWRLGRWRSAWRHFRQGLKWAPEMQTKPSKQ